MTLSEGYRQLHGCYTGYERPKTSVLKAFCTYITGLFKSKRRWKNSFTS